MPNTKSLSLPLPLSLSLELSSFARYSTAVVQKVASRHLTIRGRMAPRRLRIGVAGLGRMGKRHAMNFSQSVPRAELVAVSTPDASERQWAEIHLGPSGVSVYANFEDMLRHEGLEAVCIASVTSVHADQAIRGIAAGKHVLCEKPLATTAEVVSQVEPSQASRLGSRRKGLMLTDARASRNPWSMPRRDGLTSRSCAASLDGLTTRTETRMPRWRRA